MSASCFSRVLRYITTIAAGAVATCALFVATAALAQTAYVSHRISLRAGPDFAYPQVAWVGAGSSVYVHGCVRGYHWCDVSINGVHGWASARHLSYPYQNRRVIVHGNGLAFGAPVVGFTVSSYWDDHYRDRPWYRHNGYWSGWRPGVAVRPEYYRAQPVYVAPRPVYVRPHRVESHLHRQDIQRHHAERREAQRIRQERREQRHHDRRGSQHHNHRSAPPAVMGYTR
ncbi:MAG: SH3 domain-containing protein [Casimicrobium sp.]